MMAGSRALHIAMGLCMVALAGAAASCVYVETTESTVSLGAAHLSTGSLTWVREGQTTRQEVVDALGPPSAVRELEGGQQLIAYVCDTHRVRRVRVPLVLAKRSDMRREDRLNFEITDGVVSRLWRETSP